MDIREFDFDLPADLIAQDPAADRSAAKLLHLDRASGSITHTIVSALPTLLRAGDVVVVNNTRVFPARLLGRRVPSGGAVECLLIRHVASDDLPPSKVGATSEVPPRKVGGRSEEWARSEEWEALVHPGQKLKPGSRVVFEGARTLHCEILERRFFGRRLVRLWTEDGSSVDAAIEAIGHVPLPPYIKRDDRPDDRERYQTVFARNRGSVAAPTAGLHFTPPLLDELNARGVAVAEITLHVGYGTFQPVRVDRIEDHRLDAEHYAISESAAALINRALAEERRVIAVGTTTTRTLEAVAHRHGGRIEAGEGATDLFIYPGFDFRVIRGLLTNFHLPRSSLLMLVAAFAGLDRTKTAYAAAIAATYRFYSYGDAMLVT